VSLVHIDHTGQISFVMSSLGASGELICTMGFQTDNTDGQEVADKAWERWVNWMVPTMSSHSYFHSTRVLIHLAGNLESWEAFGSGIQAGGAPADMVPNNCAVLVQKRTAFAGKKNRGRFYMPGVSTSRVNSADDPSQLTSGALTAYQGAVDGLFTDLQDSVDGDPIIPVILHPSPSTTVTAISALSVSSRLATQRGRMRD